LLALLAAAQPASVEEGGAAAGTPEGGAEPELLEKDDPRAQQGVVVGARGIDPGWQDSRVAERSPNVYGQTGILRSISARTGKNGYFDLGLHGRFFFFDDFIRPATPDKDSYFGGQASFGVTAFDILELAVATQFATNANDSSLPATLFTTGDLLPSVKIGYAFLPLAIGVDVRALLPTAQDQVGLDAANFAVTATGLLTYDLYEQADFPLRAHLNVGYTYQNARNSGAVGAYLIPGVEGALLALTTQSWFYDQLNVALGIEAPLPYVTPFVELSTQTALGVRPGQGPATTDYDTLRDSIIVVSPGVRGSVGRGLNFDVALDVGVGGVGGGFQPDVAQLIVGQPFNPQWALQLGVSYTFSPFVAETQVEVRERAQGRVEGCVVSQETPVQDAIIEYAGMDGPRIVVDDKGCFRSPMVDVGSLTIRVTHPDYKGASATVEIGAGATTPVVVELLPAPRVGTFKGTVVNEEDESVNAKLEIALGGKVVASSVANGGAFEIPLPPGRYQVVVKAKGYLQQGTPLVIEPLGKTIAAFTLKVLSKKRLSTVTSSKIEISTTVPFALGQARLLKAAEFVLDDVVDAILASPQLGTLRVEGHSDNTGEEAVNMALSGQRAAAVVEYLVAHGVPAARLEAKGMGFSKPIATNDSEDGRAKNRRVEFVIVGGKGAP
jgi:outer membrane protein OmpA-like peptidoglycan-associated protein